MDIKASSLVIYSKDLQQDHLWDCKDNFSTVPKVVFNKCRNRSRDLGGLKNDMAKFPIMNICKILQLHAPNLFQSPCL